MLRPFLLLTLLSGLAWWLHGEQERGRFREVDNHFLDFLLAATRDQLKPNPDALGDVVFLRLREEDKAEYAAWPPLPIDYQMILKGLAPFEPATLIIAEPLQWPSPKPEFIGALADTLRPLPAVVLAVDGTSEGRADPASLAWAQEHLPALQVQGPVALLPEITQLNHQPEPELLRQNNPGCRLPDKTAMAMRLGTRLVPSLEWLGIAHATRTPLQHQRLQLGAGAGLHVGDALFVPLDPNGSLPATSSLDVPSVNALDLMTAKLTDDDAELAKTLGKGKTLVLGIDSEGPRPAAARRTAQAVAAALALPRLRELLPLEQWIIWGLAGLIGLSLLWLPKEKGLTRSLLYLLLALTGSYLAFQATKIWCPPTLPAALILASGLFCRLLGKRRPAPVPPADVATAQ